MAGQVGLDALWIGDKESEESGSEIVRLNYREIIREDQWAQVIAKQAQG